MESVDVGHELLREKEAQAQFAGMRVENVHTTFYSRASRRTCQEGLIDQGAGRMKSQARHKCASGELSKFRDI